MTPVTNDDAHALDGYILARPDTIVSRSTHSPYQTY